MMGIKNNIYENTKKYVIIRYEIIKWKEGVSNAGKSNS